MLLLFPVAHLIVLVQAIEELVQSVHFVERIVEIEINIGNPPQLLADPETE